MMTDQDPSIESALKETDCWENVPHRLYSWHISRNLRKYFRFIKSEYDDLKEKIFTLPYIQDKIIFEQNEKEIKKFLTDLNLKKSEEYLDGFLDERKSGPNLYFDADITTTSLAESWNFRQEM